MVEAKRRAALFAGAFAALVAFLLIFPAYAEISVARSGPSSDPAGSSFAVALAVSAGGETISSFDLAELVPSGWLITNWSVSGGYGRDSIQVDTRSRSYQGKIYNAYHWKFSAPLTADAELSYQVSVPASAATDSEYSFVTLWTWPGGFNSKTSAFKIGPPAAAAACGDGSCGEGENCTSCPQDCGVCWSPTCGDGICQSPEDCVSCPGDCGACPVTTTVSPGFGARIFGSPETGPGLLQQYGPYAGAGAAALVLLIVLMGIFRVVSRRRGRPTTIQSVSPAAVAQPAAPAPGPALLPEASEIRNSVTGRVFVRREAPRALSTEEKIAALRRSLVKLLKITGDLEKKV